MPDAQKEQPVRVAELKLVDKVSPKPRTLKPVEPISRPAEDVEDMWDNLPV
ncbi:MAG: hypothetical protein AAGF55_14545 [Pseudomonadota bacterium]